jgi:hypothetical protein
MSNVVLLNQGVRTYTLKPIVRFDKVKLADGTETTREVVVKQRMLPPGGSIETLDDAEATLYLGYRDIRDAANVVPANSERIKSMESEIERLKADNARLQAASEPPKTEEAPAPEAAPSKKKGK